uniref:RNA binding protein n=2 Tax=Rhizophora mucronata TaxID=61149 RepID=A0A2P2KBL7_RHIMU
MVIRQFHFVEIVTMIIMEKVVITTHVIIMVRIMVHIHLIMEVIAHVEVATTIKDVGAESRTTPVTCKWLTIFKMVSYLFFHPFGLLATVFLSIPLQLFSIELFGKYFFDFVYLVEGMQWMDRVSVRLLYSSIIGELCSLSLGVNGQGLQLWVMLKCNYQFTSC